MILLNNFKQSSAFVYSVASFFLVVVSFHPFLFEKIFHSSYANSEAFLMDPLDSEIFFFLSLVLDLYSFKPKLLSPEPLERLCNDVIYLSSEFSNSCHPVSPVYIPSSRAYIHLPVFSGPFLLALTGSLNCSILCHLPRTINISFWIILHLRWLYFSLCIF